MSDGPGTRSEQGNGKTRQYATFFVSDLFFGVEVLNVQEVLRYQEMTRVPRADNVIEGLTRISDLAPLTARVYALPRRSATISPPGRGGG